MLAPPRYEGEDDARTASLLSTILPVLIAVLALYMLLSLAQQDVLGGPANLIGLLCISAILLLLRYGQVQRARYLLGGGVWIGGHYRRAALRRL